MTSINNRVFYIASYNSDSNNIENRLNVLSSSNKINYIITILNELGYGVDLLSYSHTLNKCCYGYKQLRFGDNNMLQLFPTTWRGGMFLKIFNYIVLHCSLFTYVLFHIHKHDTVIVYHSYGILWLYSLLRLKSVNLIIECEEIYGDFFGNKWMAFLERKLLAIADAYIYPTELLNSIVNSKNKPYLVVHGAYKDVGAQFFSDCKPETVEFDPRFYHVAYTGILDPKKGCMEVVKAAEYLDGTYYIHILGFGSQSEIDMINKLKDELATKTACRVSFDGLRKGIEYTNYLKNLDLGLCTIDSEDAFTLTQFPSKIISYMAAGVPVLCSEAKAIKTCDVSCAITFYKGNSSKDIADGIKLARSRKKIDTRQLLEDCDKSFKIELNKLIINI